MSRTNRKHTRVIQSHRRNSGPALLSQVADQKMQEKAVELVNGLCTAIINNGNAAAGNLLLQLAESAEWANNPVARAHILSMAEKWSKEPQVVMLETAPELGSGPKVLELTDGTPSPGDLAAKEDDTGRTTDAGGGHPPGETKPDREKIIDADWEMCPAKA